MHTPLSLLHVLLDLLPDNPLPFPFLGVVAIVFTYALLSNLLVDFICPPDTIYIDPASSWSSSSHDEQVYPAMSVEELQETPCFDYGEGCNGCSSCAICLDGFTSGDSCRIFPICCHMFHSSCIDLWLVKSLTCPTCRSPFTSNSIV